MLQTIISAGYFSFLGKNKMLFSGKNFSFGDKAKYVLLAEKFLGFFDVYKQNSMISIVKNIIKIISGEATGLNMLASNNYKGDFRKMIKPIGAIAPIDYLEYYFSFAGGKQKESITTEGNCFESVYLFIFLLETAIKKHDLKSLRYDIVFDYDAYHVVLRLFIKNTPYIVEAYKERLVLERAVNFEMPAKYIFIKKEKLNYFWEYINCFILFRQSRYELAFDKLNDLYDQYPEFFVGQLRNKMLYAGKYF